MHTLLNHSKRPFGSGMAYTPPRAEKIFYLNFLSHNQKFGWYRLDFGSLWLLKIWDCLRTRRMVEVWRMKANTKHPCLKLHRKAHGGKWKNLMIQKVLLSRIFRRFAEPPSYSLEQQSVVCVHCRCWLTRDPPCCDATRLCLYRVLQYSSAVCKHVQ